MTLGLLSVNAEGIVLVPQRRGVATNGRKNTRSGSQPLTTWVEPLERVSLTEEARPDAAMRCVISTFVIVPKIVAGTFARNCAWVRVKRHRENVLPTVPVGVVAVQAQSSKVSGADVRW